MRQRETEMISGTDHHLYIVYLRVKVCSPLPASRGQYYSPKSSPTLAIDQFCRMHVKMLWVSRSAKRSTIRPTYNAIDVICNNILQVKNITTMYPAAASVKRAVTQSEPSFNVERVNEEELQLSVRTGAYANHAA